MPTVANAVVAPLPARAAWSRNWRPTSCLRDADSDELREQLHATLRGGCPRTWCRRTSKCSTRIPMLPSGKADRARLPAPAVAAPRGGRGAADGAAGDAAGSAARGAWGAVFGHEIISVEADFFLDLRRPFAVRRRRYLAPAARSRRCAISPSPTCTRIRPFAAWPGTSSPRAARRAGAATAPPRRAAAPQHAPRLGCGRGPSSVLLYLFLMLLAAPLGVLVYAVLGENVCLVARALAVVAGSAGIRCRLLLPVVAEMAAAGPLPPGPLSAVGLVLLPLVAGPQVACGSAPLVLAGSPLLALYLRLLGARIGRGCHLGTAASTCPT